MSALSIKEVFKMHPFISLRRQKILRRNKYKLSSSHSSSRRKTLNYNSQPENQIFEAFPSDKMYQLDSLPSKQNNKI